MSASEWGILLIGVELGELAVLLGCLWAIRRERRRPWWRS